MASNNFVLRRTLPFGLMVSFGELHLYRIGFSFQFLRRTHVKDKGDGGNQAGERCCSKRHVVPIEKTLHYLEMIFGAAFDLA